MTQIATFLENAELALAAYATLVPELTNTQPQRDALVRAGMSSPQAEEFARRYPTVVSHYNDTSTSFSATAFAAADGQLHLAIRGTKEPGDFAPTDANIGLYGFGLDQVVAMVNWWRRATASPSTSVVQWTLTEYPPTLEPATTSAVYLRTGPDGAPLPPARRDRTRHRRTRECSCRGSASQRQPG